MYLAYNSLQIVMRGVGLYTACIQGVSAMLGQTSRVGSSNRKEA
jgi:hypothetical protein